MKGYYKAKAEEHDRERGEGVPENEKSGPCSYHSRGEVRLHGPSIARR